MSIKAIQLHKRSSYQFKNIQDKYAFDEKQKCFALADGTTQSFNSEKWAEIITKSFVGNPVFVPEQLIKLFTKNVKKYNSSKFKFSSNPAKASLEKTKIEQGGTATFIGIQFIENNQINLINCGDTNFFKVNEDKVEYFPYSDIDILDSNKNYINTKKLVEQKISKDSFQTENIRYSKNDVIILATDALSRLFLREPAIIFEFINIQNFEELHQFCLKYWESRQLEEDDISAIIVKVDDEKKLQVIQPSEDFSFPKEKEDIFIPTSFNRTNNIPSNNIDMQEIRHNFNGVANDFNKVKKALSLQKILIFSIIGMLVANILITYFYKSEDDDKFEKQTSEMATKIACLENQLEIANNQFKKTETENINLKNDQIEIQKELTRETEIVKNDVNESEKDEVGVIMKGSKKEN